MSSTAPFKMSAVALMVCALAAIVSARNVDLKPGRYEVTVTYEVQHQRQNQSRTTARCIRALDLASPERIFNDRTGGAPHPEEICRVKDFKSGAGRISYDAECANRNVHVEGTVEMAGFSVVRRVMPRAGQAVPLKFMIRGKRTGNCLLADGGNSPRI